jgi:diacylglycerol kinase family enzyme
MLSGVVSRVALVVNPFASRVGEELVQMVERVLATAGEVDTAFTERPGHAVELVREACAGGFDGVVVLAGDGGFNEALNGCDGRVPLGFVPAGGTNVLPRALGLPRDAEAAATRIAEAIAAGRSRRISVGRVNGRRFGFCAGVGLDAEFIRRMDALGRTHEGRRPGDVRFVLGALRVLTAHRFHLPPTIELAGLGRVAFVLAANCDPYTYVGSRGLHVAPLARFELGLDIVGPRHVRPWTLPRFLAYVVRGRGQERSRHVVYAHDVDRATLRCDRSMALQADGEDLGDVSEVVFEAERDAAAVLV